MKYSEKYPLFLVEWIDSCQPVSKWEYFYEISPTIDPMLCWSVGWLIKEDKDHILIYPNVADVLGPNAQGCGAIQIPKVNIKRLVSIRNATGNVKHAAKSTSIN